MKITKFSEPFFYKLHPVAASGITTHPLSILYYVFALNQIMPEANSGKLIGRRDIRAQIQKF